MSFNFIFKIQDKFCHSISHQEVNLRDCIKSAWGTIESAASLLLSLYSNLGNNKEICFRNILEVPPIYEKMFLRRYNSEQLRLISLRLESRKQQWIFLKQRASQDIERLSTLIEEWRNTVNREFQRTEWCSQGYGLWIKF